MVFSTFLPTALHAGIVCFSLVSAVPNGPRAWVLDWLSAPDRDRTEDLLITVTVTLMIAVSALLPVVLVWLLAQAVAAHAPGLGAWYLWLFETFAHGIGAAVPERPAPRILPPLLDA